MTSTEAYIKAYSELGRKVSEAEGKAKRAKLDAQVLYEKKYNEKLKELNKGKKGSQKVKGVPHDEVKELIDQVNREIPWEDFDQQLAQTGAERDRVLNELAEQVVLQPDKSTPWTVVRSCSTSQYSSQTQPHFYAKGTLQPLERKLNLLGYETHVQYVKHHDGGYDRIWKYSYPDSGIYRLWSNIPDWALDVVNRTFTLQQALFLLDRVVNPQVVFGPLPSSIVDKFYSS